MDFGLTIKRPDNSSSKETGEGFQSPIPSFKPSPLAKKLSLFEIIEPDRSPAPTVHDAKLAQLMDKVRQRPDFTPIEFKESKSRPVQPVSKSAPIIPSSIDDETFIRKTRAGTNLHDPEIKELFHKAGGANYLVSGLSYAQAFEAMRRVILKRIAEKGKAKQEIAPYQRCLSSNVKSSVTPGTPTQEQFIARDSAEQEAKKRQANERWLRNQFQRRSNDNLLL